MELNPLQRSIDIDYSLIAAAQSHYEALAYERTAIPWVVAMEAYSPMLPKTATPQKTIGGFLVASAENSFLQLLQQGEELKRNYASSPCFRDEDHDETHSPYFFKLELIDTILPKTSDSVLEVLDNARTFIEKYTETTVSQESEWSWDINHKASNLELGSYGLRTVGDFSWIYGTGVALPRLQQAMLFDSTRSFS